jgi:hypothetical protein
MKSIEAITVAVCLNSPDNGSNSNRQANDIYDSIEFVSPEVSEDDGKVIPEHSFLFKTTGHGNSVAFIKKLLS